MLLPWVLVECRWMLVRKNGRRKQRINEQLRMSVCVYVFVFLLSRKKKHLRFYIIGFNHEQFCHVGFVCFRRKDFIIQID